MTAPKEKLPKHRKYYYGEKSQFSDDVPEQTQIDFKGVVMLIGVGYRLSI